MTRLGTSETERLDPTDHKFTSPHLSTSKDLLSGMSN